MSLKNYIFMLSTTIDANCFKARYIWHHGQGFWPHGSFDKFPELRHSPRSKNAASWTRGICKHACSSNFTCDFNCNFPKYRCVCHTQCVMYTIGLLRFSDSSPSPYRTGQRRLSFVRLSRWLLRVSRVKKKMHLHVTAYTLSSYLMRRR